MLKKILTFTVCLFVLYGNNAFSSDCIKIKGKIKTNTLNLEDPRLPTLGTISFRTEKERDLCAIKGQTTGVNELGLPNLEHQIVCKDHSTFTTSDSITEFYPVDECEVKIRETTMLQSTSGRYMRSKGKTVAKGTINLCTGENNFKYKGKLCPDEDSFYDEHSVEDVDIDDDDD